MTSRLSRRRLLWTAGVVTSAALLAAVRGRVPVRAQAGSPEQVLTQVLSADQLDASWFSPALLQRGCPSINSSRRCRGSTGCWARSKQ
jgi:hypothetical protein